MKLRPLEMHCYLFPFCVAIFLFPYFNVQGPYIHALAASLGSGNDTDHQALLEIKAKITGDQLGVMHLWNNTVHFCGWYGVTCSHRRQRVIKLDLRSLKLTGVLSPFIGNLSFLRVLNLLNNSFTHSIPQEIGRLHRLRELRLHNNSFVETLPSNISGCSTLEIFFVGNNLLEGAIPVALGYLSHLKELGLQRNRFTGSIPPSLGNLSALETFPLYENRLIGRIPEALGQLRNLTFFSLRENEISGIIPASIFNFSNIRTFDITANRLRGNLPSDLGITMPYVKFFSVASNQITGSFPISISNASNLLTLQTQRNKLSGRLPSFEKLDKLSRILLYENHLGSGGETDLNFICSLTNTTSLQTLSVGSNNFGGLLPECISNFSSLSYLVVQKNKIFGSVPVGIENLINLEVLGVASNWLSGSIPHGIGRLQKLKLFDASNNSLSGAVPSSLGNLTMLIGLYLGRNDLQGSIPSHLGRCENLVELDLSVNNLSGSIPPEVIGLSSLSIFLDLSSNHLAGMLPVEVENLKNLGVLDVSLNNLSGVLPDSLGSCVKLEQLYLHGNFFQGHIPSSLSSLRGLETLDLSRNNISGEIPNFLVRFESLQYLNLSFNDLEGALPTEGIFKNASATFIQGNSKLCGGAPMFHLFHLPACNLKTSTNRSANSLKFKVAIGLAMLGVTLVFSFLLLLWIRKKKEKPAIATTCAENSPLRLSYQSILKATDGFSSGNLVGSGGFGSVYRGILEEDGVVIVIAVKVFNLLICGASRSFMTECEALRNIRHRNLVKVSTAISSLDYQGNDFKALVYEFMQNGNLEEWLHPSHGMKEAKETTKSLNYIQRLNVAIDVACALEYLHHHCGTPIVHCDLKPSNILLDDEMVSHVGDFGLAKIITSDMQNNTSSLSSSVLLRGTIGYAPPEYGLGSNVTTYGDAYSYGILLLEMFTGRRPTDEMFKENMNLHNFVKTALPNQVAEVTDPILLQESLGEAAAINNHCNTESSQRDGGLLQCLNSIFEIGVACSVEMPVERMNMATAVAKLCSIRAKLLPTQV